MAGHAVLRVIQVMATAAMVVGANLASWWLIGDQSTMGPRVLTHRPILPRLEGISEFEAMHAQRTPDFAWQPLDISLETERIIGLIGLTIFAVGLAILVTTRRTFQRAWWWIIGALTILGVAVAWSHRILTAGVGGANIGGGMVLLFGSPMLIVTLGVLAFAAYRILTGPRRRLPPPPDP